MSETLVGQSPSLVWRPNSGSATDAHTHRVVRVAAERLVLRARWQNIAVTTFAAVTFSIGALLGVGGTMHSLFMLLFAIPFTLVAWVFWSMVLSQLRGRVVFDRGGRVVLLKGPVANAAAIAEIPFGRIRGLQILERGKNDPDPDAVCCYELNLVLQDGPRVLLICQGGDPDLDAASIAQLLSVPMWKGDELLAPGG
jgi:hypothetical protein